MRDAFNRCQIILPAGFFPPRQIGDQFLKDGFSIADGRLFGLLVSENGTDRLQSTAQALLATISRSPEYRDFQIIGTSQSPDSIRHDFAANQSSVRGTVYLREFGSTICALALDAKGMTDTEYSGAVEPIIASLRPTAL